MTGPTCGIHAAGELEVRMVIMRTRSTVGTVPMVVTCTILLSNIEYASTKLEHTVCERRHGRTMTDTIFPVVLATVGLAQARPNKHPMRAVTTWPQRMALAYSVSSYPSHSV